MFIRTNMLLIQFRPLHINININVNIDKSNDVKILI